MTSKFQKGDKVKVTATGHKATVYDYDERSGPTMILIRFNGRHSLDLFDEAELTLERPYTETTKT